MYTRITTISGHTYVTEQMSVEEVAQLAVEISEPHPASAVLMNFTLLAGKEPYTTALIPVKQITAIETSPED